MGVDESLFLAINGLAGRIPLIDALFLALSSRGTLYVPAVLAVFYWIHVNRREAMIGGAALGACVGLADFLGGQLKWVFERVRPCRALSQAVTVEPGGCGGLYGFPSNHALNTAAAAAFLQMLYPQTGWVSWPIVFLVGFSRVYVGAHYVSDVLGAWLLGGLLGGGCAWLLLKWPTFRQGVCPAFSTQPSNSDR